MKYKVIIEETVSESFEIDAHTEADAIDKVIQKYNAGELVLCPGNLEYKQAAILNDNSENKWITF
ncbi:DpnD/PcfM family protein [Anaerovibrio sp.]|uniref:DpnD/PcfM family protein n=1 Tax=Anaerovibrio sp. TaxID=1872532 RepID=UPI00389001E8